MDTLITTRLGKDLLMVGSNVMLMVLLLLIRWKAKQDGFSEMIAVTIVEKGKHWVRKLRAL